MIVTLGLPVVTWVGHHELRPVEMITPCFTLRLSTLVIVALGLPVVIWGLLYLFRRWIRLVLLVPRSNLARAE